jgi:hypothetical protein
MYDPIAPQPPRKSWPARHKVRTAVLSVAGPLIVLAAQSAAGHWRGWKS